MISRADIVERVTEWGLAEQVVEKDYVLGWVLWGIGSDPQLGQQWIFKGGTCLKKCYIETYRFSEDLDFTVLPDGPITPGDTLPLMERMLARVGEASGIDFSLTEPRFRLGPSGLAAEGRVLLPRAAPEPHGDEYQARPQCGRAGGATTGAAADRPPLSRSVPRHGHRALLLLRGSVRREAPGHGPARPTKRPLRHRQPLPPQ